MTRCSIFSDEDFICTIQIKQQQFFVPKEIADMYEAEQVCKKHNSTLYVYKDKNSISKLIEKFDETECRKKSHYLLKEENKSSKKVLRIQIKFEKISLRKNNSKLKYNLICQRYRISTNSEKGSDKSSSTSKPRIEGVAIGILIAVVLLIFIPAVLYASIPSIRVSLSFLQKINKLIYIEFIKTTL